MHYAVLGTDGIVLASMLPPSTGGSLTFKGTWNANTNTPALADGGVGGVYGDYYIVNVAGATSVDGNTPWIIGDEIVHNGTFWYKVSAGQYWYRSGTTLYPVSATDSISGYNLYATVNSQSPLFTAVLSGSGTRNSGIFNLSAYNVAVLQEAKFEFLNSLTKPQLQVSLATSAGVCNPIMLWSTTDILFSTDNNVDIGASGANRPKDLYLSGTMTGTTVKLTSLTDGYIPYHVSDAVGLANSVIQSNTSNVGIGVAPDSTIRLFLESQTIAAEGFGTGLYVREPIRAVTVNEANYFSTVLITSSAYNIDTGIVDSGYRYGLEVCVAAYENTFKGTLSYQKGIRITHGITHSNASAVITNSYGLMIESYVIDGTVNNLYAIYQASSIASNYFAGTITAPYFISQVATGTQPYQCTSETLNTHLNADLLDGYHGSYWASLYWTQAGGQLSPTTTTDHVNIATSAIYKQNSVNLIQYCPTAVTTLMIGNAGNQTLTGTYNVLVGVNAGYAITSGSNNLFLGYQTGYSITTESYNMYIGYQAGKYAIGAHNAGLGYNSMLGNADGVSSTGTYNLTIGENTLSTYTTASYTIAMGYNALTALTVGNGNIAIGAYAGATLTDTSGSGGIPNLLIGYYAGNKLNTQGANVHIGNYAGQNSLATSNVYIGYGCGKGTGTDNTGTGNVGIGINVLNVVKNANFCTGIGYQVMIAATTASYCTGIGYTSLWKVTSGQYNTAIGNQSLYNLTTSTYNTAIGFAAGEGMVNTIPGENVFIGHIAGRYALGAYNTIIGARAGVGVSTTSTYSSNTLIGAYSGNAITTGGLNTCLGNYTGFTLTTGTNNIFLGYYAGKYETGSNKLIIDNLDRTNEATQRTSALIYGVSNVTPANQILSLGGGGRVGINITPTANLTLPAGVITSGYAPLKFTSGTNMTNPEAGAMEFTTDDLYFTITTGAARKGFILNDGSNLTITRVPFATTNGRLTDSANMTYTTNRLSPTYITLAAGTATAGTAPLKFTNGTALATPEAGSIEFHNERFYITNVATQRAIDRTADVKLDTTTISNTTDETTCYTASIPANSLKAGNILKLNMSGTIDETAVADQVTIRIKIGGTTIATVLSPSSGVSDKCWHISGFATLRSVGGTGSMAWHIDMDAAGTVSDSCGINTVDTTAAEDVTVTAQWNNAKVGNIFTCTQGFMEYKN